MEIKHAQRIVVDAWKRSKKRMSPMIELACLMEECGELAEAMRKHLHGKNKQVDLEKEIGDVFLSLITIAIRNDVNLEFAFQRTMRSIEQRYLQ